MNDMGTFAMNEINDIRQLSGSELAEYVDSLLPSKGGYRMVGNGYDVFYMDDATFSALTIACCERRYELDVEAFCNHHGIDEAEFADPHWQVLFGIEYPQPARP